MSLGSKVHCTKTIANVPTQIYISYCMQSMIAIIGFLLLQLFDFWIEWVGTMLLWRLHGYHEAKIEAEKLRMHCKAQLAPLKEALVEFHKAQCFFILAVEITAQFVTRQGVTQLSNLGSIYLNYDLLRTIGISGLLPTTFTLFYLHSTDMKSWYKFILTLVSAVLAVALYMSQFIPTHEDISFLDKRRWYFIPMRW